MAVFSYRGRNAQGEPIKGEIDADNRATVASQLMAEGITPVSIKEILKAEDSEEKKQVRIRLLEKVSQDELIMFSRQMYSLSKAGVPLNRAMRGLASSVKNLLLQETISGLADELDKGRPLSAALTKYPRVFNDLYISLVHVGENTGRLDQTFKQMAEYLDLERQTVKNIKQATRYPMFVMSAIAIAMVVINIYVIPAFKGVFESLGANLPWQTRALIAISDFTLNWWPLIVALIVTGVILFLQWIKKPEGRLRWDRAKLKIPLVGSIFYRAILGRFARTFSIVLAAGMPIEQGLIVVSRAVGNAWVGDNVAGMRKSIERGESFTQSAIRTRMFSPLVMQMIAVGEETGRVDQMLAEAADFYEEEVDYDLKGLTAAIEPILVVVIGIMVLILALGVFLPLWELSTAMRG